nr:hypothetical protein [Tanacetum cinerariifolium]
FQRENDEFLRNINENIKKIIKGQVKSQVKEKVSRVLPRFKESVNATLEAEVLTRSSHSSRTSYDAAADLSEIELKKILIEKMEGNKWRNPHIWCLKQATPKPKANARKKKGDSASSTTPPTPTPTTTVVAAPRLFAAAKDEGTSSRPGVPDVPSNDSEEELSWNSSDDEDVDEQTKGREESEGDKTDKSDDGSDDGNDDDNDETVKAGSIKDDDDNDDEEELAKNNDEDTESGSEDEGSDEEDQELRLSEEARIQEEEEADELYRDVDINQGRVYNDAGVESIFTTASSPIVSLQTPTPIMTPSTIATITTSRDAPIPPTTIPNLILENLPTFNSAFRLDERLRSLETTFSEYRQTNPFVNAVSAIPSIVHQYMTQQMTKAVREAVQIQTDRLQDLLQRENEEFLRNIDENMKKIIKGQVKS